MSGLWQWHEQVEVSPDGRHHYVCAAYQEATDDLRSYATVKSPILTNEYYRGKARIELQLKDSDFE